MSNRNAEKSGRRAIFTGVARNCAPHLRRVLSNLHRLEGAYQAVRYVFAVGDSGDGTLEMLHNWMADGRMGHVIDMTRLERDEPRRTVRIAMARNACMSLLREAYRDFDHLIALDLDNILVEPVCAGAFAQARDWLDGNEKRAGVFANAAPRYYDVWALRHPSWCPYDVWHAVWDRHPWCSFELAKLRHVYSKQIQIGRHSPPIPVTSAFGGLSIYKTKFTSTATYWGQDADGREQAEHVAFNRCITEQGGELFVLPSLVVRAPPEHLYDPSDASFLMKWTMRIKALGALSRHPW